MIEAGPASPFRSSGAGISIQFRVRACRKTILPQPPARARATRRADATA
jgi:hypothetical protein